MREAFRAAGGEDEADLAMADFARESAEIGVEEAMRPRAGIGLRAGDWGVANEAGAIACEGF